MLKRLAKLGGALLLFAWDHAAAAARRCLGLPPRHRKVVLYYHGVSASEKQAFARQMDLLLRHAASFSLSNPPANGKPLSVALTFDDGFASVLDHAFPVLRDRHIPFTIFVPTGSLGTAPAWIIPGSPQDRGERVMTRTQLQALAADPLVTIGSHTVSHPRVPDLQPEPARRELSQSKHVLEAITGGAVPLFSFPHGAFSPRDLKLARQAGYAQVFGIEPALAFTSPNQFIIGRVPVSPSDWPIEFRLKLAGAWRWLAKSAESNP